MEYDNVNKKIEKIIFKKENSQFLEKVIDILYKSFDKYNWIGIYIVCGDDLILGPWRGPQATEHTKIPVGKPNAIIPYPL